MATITRNPGKLLETTLAAGAEARTLQTYIAPEMQAKATFFVNTQGAATVEVYRVDAAGLERLRDTRTVSGGVEEQIVLDPPFPCRLRIRDASNAANAITVEVR